MDPLPDIVRLLPGERLRWVGRPRQGLMFLPRDAYLIPFSVLWGGFAIFWNVSVWRDGAPGFFRLWGLPFLVVGVYVIAGRFAHDAWLRGRTRYAVTDRRILIVRGGSLRSLDLDRLPLADMTERADGSGTLRFGEAPSSSPFGGNGIAIWSPAHDATPQFVGIPDVRRVYELVTRAVP